jgi:hypothetical protein
LAAVFAAINTYRTGNGLPEMPGSAVEYLDPRTDPADPEAPYPGYGADNTHLIWGTRLPGLASGSSPDANVATIEVASEAGGCAPLIPVDFTAAYGVYVCVSVDADGDPSVNVLSFCTTPDCIDKINDNKTDQTQWRYPANAFAGTDTFGAAVPFSEATDGRDHWLAAGEPHCADCHAAPYTEQSGNMNPFPPFNYPAKASLMRYSRGHQDLTCQGCHESIHGLYPVSAAIDTTSYAQAAALNYDGSHGPLKCGTCHAVDENGIPTWIRPTRGDWGSEITDFDAAVTWAHTYTDEANVLDSTCQNCHEDERDEISAGEYQWVRHSWRGRTSRLMMDKAETASLGHVLGGMTNADGTLNPDMTAERNQLCTICHEETRTGSKPNYLNKVKNCGTPWVQHLTQGRVSQSVWEDITEKKAGKLCGW